MLAFLVRFSGPIICPNVGQLVMVSAGERAADRTWRKQKDSDEGDLGKGWGHGGK